MCVSLLLFYFIVAIAAEVNNNSMPINFIILRDMIIKEQSLCNASFFVEKMNILVKLYHRMKNIDSYIGKS